MLSLNIYEEGNDFIFSIDCNVRLTLNFTEIYFQIIIPKGMTNCKVNELHPLFIKCLAIGLLQAIKNNLFNSVACIMTIWLMLIANVGSHKKSMLYKKRCIIKGLHSTASNSRMSCDM